MPVSLALTFVSTLAFTIQFLIFAHFYSSHRTRFFTYLLWAWGFFAASNGLKLAEALLPAAVDLRALVNPFGVWATLCVLAAGLAYRWDYQIRRREVLGGALIGLAVAALRDPSDEGAGVGAAVRILLGGAQIAAGLAFWPRRSTPADCRGAGILSLVLCLWGVYRLLVPLVKPDPGTGAFLLIHTIFVFFYFLATFAIIIMVLDRVASDTASLKEFNERLVDGLGEGLQLVDGDFRIRHINRWLQDRFGPVVGRRCYEVLTQDGRQCPGCPMGRRHEMEGPLRIDVAGAGGRHFSLSCSPVRQPDGQVFLLDLVADATEQEQLQARLREAERLAAAGEVAAGVAHEIRNPLAAIVNATLLLEAEESLTRDERTSTLDAVKKEARRLNRILSEFLAFARPRESRLRRGDIRAVVDHVAALVRDDPSRATGVEVEVRADPAVPPVVFDPDQMTQVLWNMALNGVEAMDRGGRLSLEVGRRDGAVAIAIADTGGGIPPEERQQVFEPFYSKKHAGSGLGLTIADRIVSAHGGRIEVDSAPGGGTRFTIVLPAAQE